MSCNNSQVYTPKQNPTSGMASKYTPKVSPLGPKNSPLASSPAQLSNMCLDYTVKNYENGDFFELQDNSTLILNLQ